MSNGRILDHHWVERTTAGQTAWRDSSMPMQERRLLNALRSPSKASELYRKLSNADPQAFLELVNLLQKRGWIARVDEPVAAVAVAVERPTDVSPLPQEPVIDSMATRAARPTLPPVPHPGEVERPRLSSDLLATLDRYRQGLDQPAESSEPSTTPAAPADPLADPVAPSSPEASLARPVPPEQRPREPTRVVHLEPPTEDKPAPVVAHRLPTSAQALLSLLNDPEPPAPAEPVPPSLPVPADPAPVMDLPSSLGGVDLHLDDLVGPVTRVESTEPAPASATPAAPAWGSLGSLDALQRALQDPPTTPEPPVEPTAPETPAYVFDHDQASAQLARSLANPEAPPPPLFEPREAVGEALPLYTLPKTDMIPWEQVDEQQVRAHAATEREQGAAFTYRPDDLVPFAGEPPSSSPEKPSRPALSPARASDLGPKGPAPIEDDDLMQALSRPRRLSAPSGLPSTTTSTRPGSSSSSRKGSSTRPRNDAFQQEVQRLQAMKNEASQQEQARQDIIARKQAEEELRRMAEETRRASIAQNRAEAQRREDAQSLTNLSERMKRIRRSKDGS